MATVTRNTVTASRVYGWANTRGTPVYRHAQRVGGAVKIVAKGTVGVDTGQLQRSIDNATLSGSRGPVARISATSRHALVHHEGHKAIRPKRSDTLVFRTKDGAIVRTKRVRAVRGNQFLTGAVTAVTGKRPRGGVR
jgi:hypothetical protein